MEEFGGRVEEFGGRVSESEAWSLRQEVSQRRCCDRQLTVCSQFWHGPAANEEPEIILFEMPTSFTSSGPSFSVLVRR